MYTSILVKSKTIALFFWNIKVILNIIMKKQDILILYLSNSSLESNVIGWARHYGNKKKIGMPGDNDNPPYERGIEAIHDGWRLFQSSQLEQHAKGDEYRTGYLKYEFFFEKIK